MESTPITPEYARRMLADAVAVTEPDLSMNGTAWGDLHDAARLVLATHPLT